MAHETVTGFVDAALRAGASREQVRQALLDAGWSADQIADGLDAFAEVDFVIPVPKPRPQLSARDACRYLVLFVTLYVAAFQLGQLLFAFVNLAVPDDLTHYGEGIYRQIRWSASALIVSYPIFLYVSHRINTEVSADPVRRNAPVRRWLTYLTLFLAAAVLVGDLVSLLFNLLSGELTLRFVLKFTIVAAVAGAIFGYYLWLMKQDDEALRR